MPLVKNMGAGLWEVRSTIPNGIARIIFVMKDGSMVLLHGFIKKHKGLHRKILTLQKVVQKIFNLRIKYGKK